MSADDRYSKRYPVKTNKKGEIQRISTLKTVLLRAETPESISAPFRSTAPE